MKRALITGIAGQDGSYLAELLVSIGYEVHGVVRKEALEGGVFGLSNLRSVIDKIHLHGVSIDNHQSLSALVSECDPHECYHLASESYVSHDLNDGHELVSTMFSRSHALISSIKTHAPDCRVFFAGSSEMYGCAISSPQNETTAFHPRSNDGIGKVAAYHFGRAHRDLGDLFFSTGFLYNHESPRRSPRFVTRKVTSAVARIYLGSPEKVILGNLNAERDWGYAPDYVAAMHAMLQQQEPRDFVLGTGKLRSVRDLVETAFSSVDLNYEDFVRTDPKFFRASEAVPLCADASRARQKLGFKSSKDFTQVIADMVAEDINQHKN